MYEYFIKEKVAEHIHALLDCRIPIRSVLFHPTRPIMFICTSSHVYLYDLQRQCLVKKLFNGGQSMSCIAAHTGGSVVISCERLGMTLYVFLTDVFFLCVFSFLKCRRQHNSRRQRWETSMVRNVRLYLQLFEMRC